MTSRREYTRQTETILQSFGSQILKRRQELGMTRDQVCAKALISYSFLARLERGEISNTTLHVIVGLCAALDNYDWNLFAIKQL